MEDEVRIVREDVKPVNKRNIMEGKTVERASGGGSKVRE